MPRFKVGDTVRELFTGKVGKIERIETIAGLETFYMNGNAYYDEELTGIEEVKKENKGKERICCKICRYDSVCDRTEDNICKYFREE